MAEIFEIVLSRAGSIAQLKRDLGCKSIQHVANWRNRGIPLRHIATISRRYGISVKKLRPDDWRDYWPSGAA